MLEFRSRHRVSVLAIRHRGEALTTNLVDQTLDFGDTLLVAGDWADIGKLWDDREDFVVLTLPAEYQERLPARQRAPVAIGILIAMVAVMAFATHPEFRRGSARRAGDDRRRLRQAGRHLSHYQLEDGGADCRHAAAGDGADQDGRNGPDGEGAGRGVGIAGADRDAGGRVSGHCSGRAICFQLGDGGIDWPDCDRRRPSPARFAICVCDDGVDRLLRRLT